MICAPARRIAASIALGLLALALAGCGSGDDELTLEQQLTKLAGRRLTATEIQERLAVADMLCGFDGRVLTRIWDQLDARQLEFQDYVFGQHCPDRLSIYEEARPATGTVPEDLATTGRTPITDDQRRTAAQLLDSIGTEPEPAPSPPPRPTTDPSSTGGTSNTTATNPNSTPDTSDTTATDPSSTRDSTDTTTSGPTSTNPTSTDPTSTRDTPDASATASGSGAEAASASGSTAAARPTVTSAGTGTSARSDSGEPTSTTRSG